MEATASEACKVMRSMTMAHTRRSAQDGRAFGSNALKGLVTLLRHAERPRLTEEAEGDIDQDLSLKSILTLY